MAVRDSEGKFLEVLENAPTLDVPIEVDVFDGANPATMLATLDGAFDKRFTRELSELGAGSFKIASSDPKATEDIIAIGNLVKFRVGGIYRHAIWIEEPATTVVSEREEGGEEIRIDGRGALAYLERGVVYPPIWPPAAGAFRSGASSENAVGESRLDVPRPAGLVAGDVVLATVVSKGSTPATPSGWRRIRNITNGTLRLSLYRKRAVVGEPASWRFSWSTATRALGYAVALANATADDTQYAINDTTGSGTAVKLPSVSVGVVDGVLLGFAAVATSTTLTAPGGWTEDSDRNAGTATEWAAHLTSAPALGETGDVNATAAASSDWIGMQVFVPSTAQNDATFDGSTFGSVLSTLIDAAQARGVIPHLTYDFTADVDSHGEPWADVHDLSFHVGTSILEVWRHLVGLGLEGGMTPELRLQAFNDASRHFETTVILRKGHHFTGDVVDTAHSTELRTRVLAEGAGGRVVEVADPVLEADTKIGRREGYLSLSTSDNATTLQRAGETALEIAAAEDDARAVKVVHGLAEDGQYEPWVDYREGDWIGMDADGSGGEAIAQRVVSITLEETEAGDYDPELELNSIEMDAFLRLQRRLDALSRDTTASGSGGIGGTSSSASTGKVAAVATDAPGYLFDKVVTDATLTKTLVGDTGSQRVQLGVAPGGTHPDLATHDALGLATDAELAALAATATAADAAHVAAADPHTGYQRESEKGAANGYAPLSSGVLVPVAYLGSGTPDSTVFLRGDGTWASPPGGGSGLTVEEVDGSPTVVATKLVLPNGTLGVVGTVATYTPSGGSGSVPEQALPYPTSASGDDDLSASTAGWSDVGANAYTTFSSDGKIITAVVTGASKTAVIRKTLGTTKAAAFDFRLGLLPYIDWWASIADQTLTVFLKTSGGSQIAAVRFDPMNMAEPATRSLYLACAGSGGYTRSSSMGIPYGASVTLRITRDGSDNVLFYYAIGPTPIDLLPVTQPGSGTYRAPLTFSSSGTVARIEIQTATVAGPAASSEWGFKLDYFQSV